MSLPNFTKQNDRSKREKCFGSPASDIINMYSYRSSTTNMRVPEKINGVSLFGSNTPNPANKPQTQPATTKIAISPDAEVIMLDDAYDLTLVVGTADQGCGQKKFCVSASVLKLVSPVWKAMFSGRFIESTKSEIPFPDDSAQAFLTVLRIAHFKSHEVPKTMDLKDLLELARLCDKYELTRIVTPYAQDKDWLQQLKGNYEIGPPNIDLQDWIYLAATFELHETYEYLVNRLAMCVKVDEKNRCFYYMNDVDEVKLSEDLPDRILNKVNEVRTAILEEFLRLCTKATKSTADDTCPYKRKLCTMTRNGVIMAGVEAIGLHPCPDNTSTMYESVLYYWDGIQNIGNGFRDYTGKGLKEVKDGRNVIQRCNFSACFAGFGILGPAREVLKKNACKDLWAQWKKDNVISETSTKPRHR